MPAAEDFLLELLHQSIAAAQPAAMSRWRHYLAKALEAWNLSLAIRLLKELARHDLDTLGQAHLRMGRGGLLFKRDQWPEALAELEEAERLFAETEDTTGRYWVLMTLGNLYSDGSLGFRGVDEVFGERYPHICWSAPENR
jgi:tetratricopeptide (TPR) repeat protein